MNTPTLHNRIRLSLLMIIFLGSLGIAKAQSEVPLLLDKTTLAGIGLDTIKLKNEPERRFFQKNLYRGEDLSVYVVSSQSWVGRMDNFSIDEFIYLSHGMARVRPESGGESLFHTGDYFFAHKGYTGEWEIDAGLTNHYELSVITTDRVAPPEEPKLPAPVMLDKSKLSGADILFDENGLYEEILQVGVELTVAIKAEMPQKKEIENVQEQLICLLSGQLTFTSKNGDSQSYLAGDFILFPKGISGDWESKGHGAIKYLSIRKS